MLVDLHTHSTASDGTLSPEELVNLSSELNVKVLSLTDHDTVSGIGEAAKRAELLNITFIPGIEVTADTSFLGEGKREFHILGYYIDVNSKSIADLTSFFQITRKRRNEELLSRLFDKGFNVDYQEMEKRFGANFGKPNIAKVLMEKGFCSTRDEAFALMRELGVKREKLDYREIVKLIKESGGISVIAHPVTLKLTFYELYSFLKAAKTEGISGVEVYHPDHKLSDVFKIKRIAGELNLLYTGGSDFHGENKPNIKLGMLKIRESDINFPVRTALV